MALPTIVPVQYDGTVRDFLKVKHDTAGAARIAAASVTVPTGSAYDTTIVGLIPFQKGARIVLNDKSVYTENIGAGSTTLNIGVAYASSDDGTDNLDAWASDSAAAQSGGFVTIDEADGLTLVTTGRGWLTAQIGTANTDNTGVISVAAVIAYDGLGVNNSNNQN